MFLAMIFLLLPAFFQILPTAISTSSHSTTKGKIEYHRILPRTFCHSFISVLPIVQLFLPLMARLANVGKKSSAFTKSFEFPKDIFFQIPIYNLQRIKAPFLLRSFTIFSVVVVSGFSNASGLLFFPVRVCSSGAGLFGTLPKKVVSKTLNQQHF